MADEILTSGENEEQPIEQDRQTTNYLSLILPKADEWYDVGDMNHNSERIDEFLRNLALIVGLSKTNPTTADINAIKVDKKIQDAIDNLIADAPEALDTLKEIVDYIGTMDDVQSGSILKKIMDLQNVIGELTNLDTNNKDDIVSAINEIANGCYSIYDDIYKLDGSDKLDLQAMINKIVYLDEDASSIFNNYDQNYYHYISDDIDFYISKFNMESGIYKVVLDNPESLMSNERYISFIKINNRLLEQLGLYGTRIKKINNDINTINNDIDILSDGCVNIYDHTYAEQGVEPKINFPSIIGKLVYLDSYASSLFTISETDSDYYYQDSFATESGYGGDTDMEYYIDVFTVSAGLYKIEEYQSYPSKKYIAFYRFNNKLLTQLGACENSIKNIDKDMGDKIESDHLDRTHDVYDAPDIWSAIKTIDNKVGNASSSSDDDLYTKVNELQQKVANLEAALTGYFYYDYDNDDIELNDLSTLYQYPNCSLGNYGLNNEYFVYVDAIDPYAEFNGTHNDSIANSFLVNDDGVKYILDQPITVGKFYSFILTKEVVSTSDGRADGSIKVRQVFVANY